MRLEFVEFV